MLNQTYGMGFWIIGTVTNQKVHKLEKLRIQHMDFLPEALNTAFGFVVISSTAEQLHSSNRRR